MKKRTIKVSRTPDLLVDVANEERWLYFVFEHFSQDDLYEVFLHRSILDKLDGLRIHVAGEIVSCAWGDPVSDVWRSRVVVSSIGAIKDQLRVVKRALSGVWLKVWFERMPAD